MVGTGLRVGPIANHGTILPMLFPGRHTPASRDERRRTTMPERSEGRAGPHKRERARRCLPKPGGAAQKKPVVSSPGSR